MRFRKGASTSPAPRRWCGCRSCSRSATRPAGYNTACYISGYRGSPLGGFDQQLWAAKPHLEAHNIVFQPGVNEDLAATACWGTQQAHLDGDNKYDGVFAIWYGKGPGVDRTGDAFRHGNLAGSAALGGVICLMGDDHTCESSTTAHQSEFAMVDAMMPILNPAGVQELLDYGLYGWALSRYSGLLGGPEVHERHDRCQCVRECQPGAREHRHSRRFQDARRRTEYPLAGCAARPGSALAHLETGGCQGFRACQQARPGRRRFARARNWELQPAASRTWMCGRRCNISASMMPRRPGSASVSTRSA